MKTKLLAVGILVVLAAAIFWQNAIIHRLVTETSAHGEKAALAEKLLAEDQRSSEANRDAQELERLRKEHQELLRLRGQIGQLRQQLQQTSNALSRLTAAARANRSAEDPAPQAMAVTSYVAHVQATLAGGQALVTGGWATRPGKRVLLFVSPELASSDTEPANIALNSRLVEVPDAVLSSLGMQEFKADSSESALRGILSSEQLKQMLKTLEETQGVDVLSAPRVMTLDGRQAQVKVTEIRTIDGQPTELGPVLDLVPHLSSDQKSVDLTVSARLNQLVSPSP